MHAQPERDAAIERWLREEVVPGHAKDKADPSALIPADEVLARIELRRTALKPR